MLKSGSKERESSSSNVTYEFGPFRLDPLKRLLLREDEAVALTPKAFDTLLLLIENRDKALLKEELMERLWPESFVEESNLTQTIFVLRKALGEMAPGQQYITTVRGAGYRFAAKVLEVENREDALQAVAPPKAPQLDNPLFSRWPTPAPANKFVIAVLLVAAVGAIAYWRLREPWRSPQRDTIVIAEFDNKTGDSLFDLTLRQALSIQFEQSPFLTVLSDQRVDETLKLMNRQPGTLLTKALALDVCQRNNEKAAISGSIAKVGNRYLLSLEALDCRDGTVFASDQSSSESKEGVLDAISQCSSRMRRTLGESLPSIQKFDRPLREVTTSSLEALKAYSTGAQMVREERDEAAAGLLLVRAIELDPQFAMAYAYLGITYQHRGEWDKAASYAEKAYSLRSRVSEKERLLITEFYLYLVTGDVEKEIETDQQWTEEFPRDYIPLNDLGGIYSQYLGEYEKCIELHTLAWQLEPKQPYSPVWLATCHAALNQLQQARALLDHALADGYDSVDIRSALHLVALLQGDPKTADAQSRWSANQPATANLAGQIAEVSLQRGAIKDARAIVDKQIQQLRATGSNEPAAKTAGLFAIYEAEFGNASDSRKLAILSKTLFQGRVNLGLVALAFAINGDDTEARGISEALKRKYPSDTDERVAGALASAMLDLHANRPGNALSDLADVQRYENGANWCFEIHYVRGQAHLRNQQPSEAAADFQQIIDHRGISPSAPEWVLAHLGLARAYALQRDNAKAQAAYKEFFALWNQVDPEIPILKQAHAEFAKLQ